MTGLWIEEEFHHVIGRKVRVRSTLFSARSEFHHVAVLESEGLGKLLIKNGQIVLSERDGFACHEMMTHPALFLHPHPRRVLVVGGGDGGVVREVLKHPSVQEVSLIEKDSVIVEACRRYFPGVDQALSHSKVKVQIGDAVEHLAHASEVWDVILVDSVHVNQSEILSTEFYDHLVERLSGNGILISRANSPYFEIDTQKSVLSLFRNRFERIHLFLYSSVLAPKGGGGLFYASKGICPLLDLDVEKVRKFNTAFKYYNEAIHRGAFAIPEFVRKELRDYISPFPVND